MKSFEKILSQFESIDLEQMEEVKLMNRTDTKFSFPSSSLPELLDKLSAHYFALNVHGTYLCSYKTVYFDTNDFLLYRKHHSGHLNRYKVRHRTYLDTQTAFLEVKFKNNKGRTIKDRIKQKTVPLTWDTKCADFLVNHTPYLAETLKPVVWISYQRITLVGKSTKERVTIDLNLEFANNKQRQKIQNLVIAEVKQGTREKSPVLNIFKQYRLKQESISKYCMGISYLYPQVKHNNFKEKLYILNKIANHDNIVQFASGF